MTRGFGLSPRAMVTIALVAGLLAALVFALFLAYYSELDASNAFAYQSAVVSAQRDSELLEAKQFDQKLPPAQLAGYEKLLDLDLGRVNDKADSPQETVPNFHSPATRGDYERLTVLLENRAELGSKRFEATLRRNTQTRVSSNLLFALVALLFVVVQSRLRRRIEEERSLVERLQRAFVARRRELRNLDAGSVLISATRGSNVGGDLHDLFTIDGKQGMFLVADVSGKGIDAAVDTALIKYSIRALFSENPDPSSVLERFAKLYEKMADDPETFVVLFVGVIDLDDGTVRYASAGHDTAWARFGQDVVQLAPTGSIVGIEAEPRFETRTLHLRAGNAIVLSTDGLTESRDARGRMLGVDGVTVWLAEIDGSAQTIADAIVQRLRRRSRRILDDLAILVVRYNPGVPAGLTPLQQEQLLGEPALVSGESPS